MLGRVLFAEWVEDDGSSCRLAPDPQRPGQLQLVTFAPHDPALLGCSIDVTGDHPAANMQLRYQIYWRNDPDGAIERAFEVFRG